jgi:hypothetical protein
VAWANRSPLLAPATREDVEVQRADRIVTNEPGGVSSARHPLLEHHHHSHLYIGMLGW